MQVVLAEFLIEPIKVTVIVTLDFKCAICPH